MLQIPSKLCKQDLEGAIVLHRPTAKHHAPLHGSDSTGQSHGLERLLGHLSRKAATGRIQHVIANRVAVLFIQYHLKRRVAVVLVLLTVFSVQGEVFRVGTAEFINRRRQKSAQKLGVFASLHAQGLLQGVGKHPIHQSPLARQEQFALSRRRRGLGLGDQSRRSLLRFLGQPPTDLLRLRLALGFDPRAFLTRRR